MYVYIYVYAHVYVYVYVYIYIYTVLVYQVRTQLTWHSLSDIMQYFGSKGDRASRTHSLDLGLIA